MSLFSLLLGKPNINEMKAKKDVKGLISSLAHKDLEIKRGALSALGELRDSRAIKPIIDLLGQKDVSTEVKQALARMEPADVIPLLIEKIGSSGSSNRDYAKQIVILIGKPSIPSLWKIIMEGKSPSRNYAADLLDEIGAVKLADIPEANSIAYLIAKNRFEECVQYGQTAVGTLSAFISSPEWDYRKQYAVKALGKIGGSDVIEYLTAALLGDDSNVRGAAIEVFGNIGDDRAVELLIRALKIGNSNPNDDTREKAALALGKISDNRAVLPLVEALTAPYPHYGMCDKISKALININGPAAIEALAPVLGHESWNPSHFAEEAIEGLLNKNEACAAAALVGQNKKIQTLAAKAAEKHGPALAEHLLKALEGAEGDSRWYISKALAKISKAPDIDKDLKDRILKHQSVLAQLQPKCAICGANVSENTEKTYGVGADMKLFCGDKCWDVRGRLVGGSGGSGCPYYTVDRMCTASQPALPCSLQSGFYGSSCSVYSYKARGVLPY